MVWKNATQVIEMILIYIEKGFFTEYEGEKLITMRFVLRFLFISTILKEMTFFVQIPQFEYRGTEKHP